MSALEKRLIVVACVLMMLGHLVARWPVSRAPGVLVPEEPVQTAASKRIVGEHDDVQLTRLADYRIRARVLGTQRYRFDRLAAVSPLDLALGWGAMSDTRVLEDVRMTQGYRHTYVQFEREMASGTRHRLANTHVIPADDDVLDALYDLKRGDIVTLTGELVEVTAPDFVAQSSLRRDDTGDGACEILLVRSVVREPR